MKLPDITILQIRFIKILIFFKIQQFVLMKTLTLMHFIQIGMQTA